MGVLLQVRDLPEHVHRALKARAAADGVSLSQYVRDHLEAMASRPTATELEARIVTRGPVALPPEVIVDAVRAARDPGG